MISTRSRLAVVVLLVLSSCAHAQSTTSVYSLIINQLWLTADAETIEVFAQAGVADSIVKGKVTDQSGAGVSQAVITVMDPQRGVVRSVKSDNTGAYHRVRYRCSPTPRPSCRQMSVAFPSFQFQHAINAIHTLVIPSMTQPARAHYTPPALNNKVISMKEN